ncbi:transposase [Chloroflexus sp.]|uniref:IS701 family transposase n=1 Tax=Chloroflexus sp. TaxID=1904827 RepID=UPI002ADD7E34|nr:transposase [Chloroflexus sp.]
MNPPKCDELDYIHFLVAAQNVFSNTEAARCHPCAGTHGPAHAASTRLLYRCQADGNALWEEVQHGVSLTTGFLIIDDTTLDKPSRRAIELVRRHWSGKHHRVVVGINLISMLWTDGKAHLPGDVRIADTAHDGLTKNDHFQAMVTAAAARGCQPHLLGCDRWSDRVAHVKLVRALNWQWLTQLNANRLVDPDGSDNRPIRAVLIPRHGAIVHLNGYGFINVFKIAPPDGGIAYWATSDLGMSVAQGAEYALYLWRIEAYHRGITQFCGIERAQHRSAVAQRNHIGLALRAFLRLESHRLRTGTSWFEAKAAIVREAIRAYLAQPLYTQISTA